MRNEVLITTFWYGVCENAWFGWFYDSGEWGVGVGDGVGLQIQSYLGFYLSQSTKIKIKLKLRRMSFFLLSNMYLVICILMNIYENLKMK